VNASFVSSKGMRRAAIGMVGSIALLAPALSASASPAAPHRSDAGPKNVIVLIGDGMGYNEVDQTSSYQHGTTNYQVVGNPLTGSVTKVPGTPSQVYEKFPVQVASSTYSLSGRAAYDPQAAWAGFGWVADGATDSAAAGTALATGVKTQNGVVGLDGSGNRVENLTERAKSMGKSTGLVTSVPFSHATPATYGAHNADRNDLVGVTNEYLSDGTLDVVIGAGNPAYDDSHQLLATPSFGYVSEPDWTALKSGQTPFKLIETKAGFTALATSKETPKRVFGAVQVGSTLQQGRSGAATSAAPFSVQRNDVPDLATLTKGALNVLDANKNGMFAMIEGGAVDWAGHANSSSTNVEEMVDFNSTVETVVDWVNTKSSWDETLVIVTADHETGYLTGAGSDPAWTVIDGARKQLPATAWNSAGHTNGLVPVYAKGPGSAKVRALATGTDPLRGAYLDNTDLANVLLTDLWADKDVRGHGHHAGRVNPVWLKTAS
jgi:alkaline phosphatase